MDRLPDKIREHNSDFHLITRSRALDIAAIRRHFAGLETLAREVKGSRDPRVLDVALGVLAMQPENVRELLIRI
jgi:hypothetical protein